MRRPILITMTATCFGLLLLSGPFAWSAEGPPAGTPPGPEPEAATAVPADKLSFVNTELFKVIEVFSRLGGWNLFLDQDVENSKLTFFAKDLSVRQALDQMLATNGLKMKNVAPKTWLVYPAKKEEEYEADLVSHVFLLQNRDAKTMINILKGIGKKSKVFMNEAIDAVVLMDTPENIEIAMRLVRQMDYKVEQVLIDVKLVEIQSGSLKDLGPMLGSTALTFGEFKALPTAKTNVVLQSLLSGNKATILAAPRVRVLDKEKAEINVGDKIPIEITTSSRSAAGDNIQLNKSVQWESVGIKLRIEVVKIHENRDLTIKLYNEVSSVLRYTSAGYPEIRTRNADTILSLKDGETVVFGGLMNSNVKRTVTEIPLLARLPGVGRMFKDIRRETTQSEIVMFVTPHIGQGIDEAIPTAEPSPAIRELTVYPATPAEAVAVPVPVPAPVPPQPPAPAPARM